MSKLLLDVRTLDLHPPTTSVLPASAPVGLIDRVSLRLGLWLLLRSADRAKRRDDRELVSRIARADTARSAREDAATRRLHLSQPHL